MKQRMELVFPFMDGNIPRCIVILILILAGGFFAAAETAFSYCNRIRMKTLAEEEGNRRAARVVKITDRFDSALVTVLVGNNVIHVAASVLATALALRLVPGRPGEASLLSTVILTLLVFFFSETIPKSIARAQSDALALAFSVPIQLLMWILTPVSVLFSGLSAGIKKLFRVEEEAPTVTEDEFATIVETTVDEGVLEPSDNRIIQSAIEFSDTTVGECMCPRAEMTVLDIHTSTDALREALLSCKYSRLPVYSGTENNIVGILQTKIAAHRLLLREDFSIAESITAPYRVRPDMKLDLLFEEMGRRRTHIAIVENDRGDAIGLVTMEDILEEIVGEIYDEDEEVDPEVIAADEAEDAAAEDVEVPEK